MHAHVIVQRFIEVQLTRIHAARRRVLAEAVTALMKGHFLSLSRLARGLTGASGLKAALKHIDRLIGHARIEGEAQWVAAAIAARLKAQGGPLVIAIDWSAVGPGGAFVELRAVATVPGKGGDPNLPAGLSARQARQPPGRTRAARCLVRLDRYRPRGDRDHGRGLSAGLVRPCRAPRLGVDRARASGRASRAHDRARSLFHECGELVQAGERQGTARERLSLDQEGRVAVRRGVGAPSSHETQTLSLPGTRFDVQGHARGRCQRARAVAAGARFAPIRPRKSWRSTPCACRSRRISATVKSVVYGMGHEISRSRSARRLQALLVIATLAAFLLWHIGQLAEAEGLHRRFKATTRAARELSVITLARLLCALPCLPLTDFAIHSLYLRLGVRR